MQPIKDNHPKMPPHRPEGSKKTPGPPRARQYMLIASAALLAVLLLVYLTNPSLFQRIASYPPDMPQYHEGVPEQPASTPILTDPGTTPPPLYTQTEAPEPTQFPIESNTAESEDATALEVYLIDVGQADSIFLRSPKGKTMLIDSGEAQNFEDVCAFLDAQGIKKLDVVVATHPHNDHIGSMYKIIDKYDIGKFYIPAVTHTTATYEKMLDALADKSIVPRIAYAKPNAKIAWGDGSVTARIISPFEGIEYEMNDWSVVLHVSFGETSILLTGDAEIYAESVILANYSADELDADVLKLGHHGSSTSTTEAFLNAVSPEIAIISVGKDNDYGHPHAETLKRLKKRDIDLYRTDKNGIITVILDGKDVKVTTERKK